MPKKRRTRQHIIAELSVNYVERYALQCGFSVERVEHDYGIDLVLFTYDANGEIENGQVYLQLKATDNLRVAQFIGVCRRSKWSKHFTNSPLLALLAMVGSNAACKISSACSKAFR